jgi:hypothetical protein
LTFVGEGDDAGKYFEGIITFKISGFYVYIKFNCHGSRDLEGIHIKGISAGPLGGPYSFEGYIH